MMQAVQITQYGGPEVLELAATPMPKPGPGQVLVRIRAAGVNPFDKKIRSGWLAKFYPLTLPAVAGGDFAGEIVENGAGAARRIGERVFGMINPMLGGTYAQYLAVDADLARRAPANASFEEAAALPMVGQTAIYALETLGDVKAGHNVLVHGAGGGVGGVAVQIAKAAGARVIATCSGGKRDRVLALGADEVIDYTTTDFRTVAKDIDLAVDPLGGQTNLKTYEVMKPGGVILVVLRYDPTEMQNREAMSARYNVVVKDVAFDNEPHTLDRVRALFESGKLKANVQEIMPLADARRAHELVGSGHVSGKVVLRID